MVKVRLALHGSEAPGNWRHVRKAPSTAGHKAHGAYSHQISLPQTEQPHAATVAALT